MKRRRRAVLCCGLPCRAHERVRVHAKAWPLATRLGDCLLACLPLCLALCAFTRGTFGVCVLLEYVYVTVV